MSDLYPIVPIAKPRQTRRDKWMVRPAVARYRAFADKARALGIEIPDAGAWVIFRIPMPGSWNDKKKAAMNGIPHQAKKRNDADNLLKSLLDAVRKKDDSGVYDIRVSKFWSRTGSIETRLCKEVLID